MMIRPARVTWHTRVAQGLFVANAVRIQVIPTKMAKMAMCRRRAAPCTTKWLHEEEVHQILK